MNTLMYIGALFLLLGWTGLLIIGWSYKYDDKKDTLHYECFPKTNPVDAEESGNKE